MDQSKEKVLKIVGISDTHNRHNKLVIPECDILIHAGDATGMGRESEVRNFAKWFDKQDAGHLIWVPGNHEKDFEDCLPHSLEWFKEECPTGIILINESVNIEGINIYGSPVTPWFYDWAWNVHRHQIKKYWNNIPLNTDILITHGPPHQILDEIVYANGDPKGEFVGCWELSDRIKDLKQLKHHLFGHIHFWGGQTVAKDGILYHNLSICDEAYMPSNPITIIDYIKE